jgi:hypothetical protein
MYYRPIKRRGKYAQNRIIFEEYHLHNHLCENLKSYIELYLIDLRRGRHC